MQVNSYAKINLFLEILGKLPNNYHEVNTVFCSIDLCDSIKYVLTKKPDIKLWSNLEEMESSANLVYRVAEYLQRKYNPGLGIEIDLEKRIPLAAGLGGGSSNASVTLLVLNKLWDLRLSEETLHAIAAEFGSDLNFFLLGGTALGTGRGEQITPMEDLVIDNILLVNPGLRISAGEAYGLVDLTGISPKTFDPKDMATGFNRLEAGIRDKYPAIDRILNDLCDFGALQSLMSGSGSTCYGIFNDEARLSRCQKHMEQQGFWTAKTRTISKKEYSSVFEA